MDNNDRVLFQCNPSCPRIIETNSAAGVIFPANILVLNELKRRNRAASEGYILRYTDDMCRHWQYNGADGQIGFCFLKPKRER